MNDKSPLTRNPGIGAEPAIDGHVAQNANVPMRENAENVEAAAIPAESPAAPLRAQPSAEDPGLKILLTRMDTAFCEYSSESEKLSVLLSEHKDMPGWTSYHELLRQRTAEVVAYEQYRTIQDELFKRIVPPNSDETPEAHFRWLIAKPR
jgi:hypothetical protein